jgi:hypothetical protein
VLGGAERHLAAAVAGAGGQRPRPSWFRRGGVFLGSVCGSASYNKGRGGWRSGGTAQGVSEKGESAVGMIMAATAHWRTRKD